MSSSQERAKLVCLVLIARVPYKVKRGDLKDKTPVFELEV